MIPKVGDRVVFHSTEGSLSFDGLKGTVVRVANDTLSMVQFDSLATADDLNTNGLLMCTNKWLHPEKFTPTEVEVFLGD